MSKVAILTDSTVAMPAEICLERGITVVPLSVNWEGKTYLDGIDMKPEVFYDRLRASKTLPTSSQPSEGLFAKEYARLLDEGYDVFSVLISAGLSGTCTSALQAMAGFPKERIVVMDSRQASAPLTLMALMLNDAARQGASLKECKALADDLSKRVRTLFVVETLEFLHRGGRIGTASRFLGTALDLKPILTITDGKIAAFEKVRTMRKALDRAFDVAAKELEPHGTMEYLAIVTANAPELGAEMLNTAHQRYTVKNEFVGYVSPVIGVHVGPGAAGLVYVPAK